MPVRQVPVPDDYAADEEDEMNDPRSFPDIDLADLQAHVRGPLVRPADPEYNAARSGWNARFDRHPGAILRCRGTADVMAAVNFAREHRLPLAVRGGGHDFAGHSVLDGGLMIDLSPMKGIHVDPTGRTARVQPGVTWGELDHEAQAFGLATTGGTVSTVGVAGYTLGGGTGYLARRHGLAVDNLMGADLVTADGNLIRADETTNADLFWALRGGGGNFGVVTSFEYRLHPVGPEIMAGQIVHPLDAAKDALALYRSFMAEAPDEVTAYPFFLRLPPIEAIPPQLHGKPGLILVMAHTGSVAEGGNALQPLTDFGDPILSAVQPMPYAAAQQMFDAGMPKGNRRYSRAQYFREIPDGAIDTLVEWAGRLQGPFTTAYFEPMGGAINRIESGATAFPHRSTSYSFHLVADWTDPAHDEEIMEWADGFHAAMAEHTAGGVYVNLLSENEGERIREAYGENYRKLARIKAAWDPHNLFRRNQNIEPAT
ncbi:FAD-binding oxidoreductase [soil metagenome]